MAHFIMYGICPELWQGEPGAAHAPDDLTIIRQMLREVQVLSRRIAKRVNLDTERSRLLSCLEGLEARILAHAREVATPEEFGVALKEGAVPLVRVDAGYLDLLAYDAASPSALQETPAFTSVLGQLALGQPLIAPEDVSTHLSQVEAVLRSWHAASRPAHIADGIEARSAWLRDCWLANGVGLMEVYEELDGRPLNAPVKRPHKPRPQPPGDVSLPGQHGTAGHDAKRVLETRLIAEVESALTHDTPVNMSNQSHDISIDVLASFIRVRPDSADEPFRRIRIVYADGSEAERFPLRCLDQEDMVPEETVVLRAALMSMRHVDLDLEVDFAWYRNKEVSQMRALAETDAFCSAYSRKQLLELLDAYDGTHITLHMYHTGFEPAVVGLYRALVAVLAGLPEYGHDRPPAKGQLRVLPVFFRGPGTYEPSTLAWS
jgi:hypothetical protein